MEIGTTGHAIDRRGINHPAHYNNHPSGVEVIEVNRHMTGNVAAAFKYVLRRGEKVEHGLSTKQQIIKDLDKALWYLTDQMKMHEAKDTDPKPSYLWADAGDEALIKMTEHETNDEVAAFMLHIGRYCGANSVASLGRATQKIQSLKAQVEIS